MAIESFNNQNINNLAKSSLNQTTYLNNQNTENIKEATNSVPASASKAANIASDAVSVSDTAQKLNSAQEKAKNSSGIDEKKIASIKKAINEGTYKIDYDKLADKIISKEIDLSDVLF